LLGYRPIVATRADRGEVLHRRGIVAGAIDRGLGQAVSGDVECEVGFRAARDRYRQLPALDRRWMSLSTRTGTRPQAREGAGDAENAGVWTRDRRDETVSCATLQLPMRDGILAFG
jgi:hypothetical protein